MLGMVTPLPAPNASLPIPLSSPVPKPDPRVHRRVKGLLSSLRDVSSRATCNKVSQQGLEKLCN
jgi:hypothetical protein